MEPVEKSPEHVLSPSKSQPKAIDPQALLAELNRAAGNYNRFAGSVAFARFQETLRTTCAQRTDQEVQGLVRQMNRALSGAAQLVLQHEGYLGLNGLPAGPPCSSAAQEQRKESYVVHVLLRSPSMTAKYCSKDSMWEATTFRITTIA